MMRKIKAKAGRPGAQSAKPARGAAASAPAAPAACEAACEAASEAASEAAEPAAEPAAEAAPPAPPAPEAVSEAAPEAAGVAGGCDSLLPPEPPESHRPPAKRSRKSKYNLHVDCVLEGQKRRKFNFESSEILKDFSGALGGEDYPLIQTPHTFFRSLCDLFKQEFPNMLSEHAISAVVSSLDDD
jgi:hypothetical protein